MRARLDQPTRWRIAAIVAALCLASSWPARAGAPAKGLEATLEEADGHASASRHDEALRAYSRAFTLMTSETRASGVGEFVALAAGREALADFEARGSLESLETARGILRVFIAAVEAGASTDASVSVDAAKQQLAEIEARLPGGASEAATKADDDVDAEPVEPPASEAEPEPEILPRTDEETQPEGMQTMGLAGVGMLAVGGAGVIAGVTLVALPDREGAAGTARASTLVSTKVPGYVVLGSAATLAIVGAVLLGAERAQAKRRARSRVAEGWMHPWIGAHGAGLGVVGRF